MQAKTQAAVEEAEKAAEGLMADAFGRSPVYKSSPPGIRSGPAPPSSRAWMGRWYHHFQEFARVHLGAGTRTDFLAVPGGIEPMSLFDLVPKDFNFFRRRLEGLVEAHGTRQDCRHRASGLCLVQVTKIGH
jgi:hypothetical protein